MATWRPHVPPIAHARILVAVDLEPRIALEAYDDHDDVLDAVNAGRNVDEREAAVASVDNLIEALRNG
ncbi:MAG: hypothetical protein M3O28_07415 [Actinomycetota bacterium]|nr:hypothetical protein [Actinomycetota bacterium]